MSVHAGPGFDAPREAAASDFEAIAALQTESWRSAYRGILPAPYLDHAIVDERRAFWRRAAQAPSRGRIVLVSDAGPALAGFVSVSLGADADIDATVENLHVSPRLRGRGLGRRLLGAMASRLAALPARSVCLWVFDRNEAALRFYRNLDGEADLSGFDDFAGAHAPHTRIVWPDVARLLAACERS